MAGSGVRARPGRRAWDYGTVGADSSGVWGGWRGGRTEGRRAIASSPLLPKPGTPTVMRYRDDTQTPRAQSIDQSGAHLIGKTRRGIKGQLAQVPVTGMRADTQVIGKAGSISCPQRTQVIVLSDSALTPLFRHSLGTNQTLSGLPHSSTRYNDHMFEQLRTQGFEIKMLHHAEAILTYDMPRAAEELQEVLAGAKIPCEELVRGGGGEGQLTQRLRRALNDEKGWRKHNFEVKRIVDGVERESISHEIDHVKSFPSGTFALEIEWNNKDPFFDRDLENFKRLHADGVISIGGIITRGESLQNSMRYMITEFAAKNGIRDVNDLAEYYSPTNRQIRNIEAASDRAGSFEEGWAQSFVSDKFGEATTHWRKLMDRIDRGVGNPCPLVLIGIPCSLVTI